MAAIIVGRIRRDSRTIQRNRSHWEKYYEDTKIVRKSIDRITVEDFFHSCISEYDLTKKELDNMKLIFKDLMKYAKKKGLILSNPYDDIEIYFCFRKVISVD